jgi:DUF4097 and DUF4098 domain-containing protein YvlB
MRALRKITLVAVTVAAIAAPATAQDSAAQRERARQQAQEARERAAQERRARNQERMGPEYTEAFSRTVRIGRNGTFDLSNVSGDVVVTGGGGDDVKIDAVKRVRSRNEGDAKAVLQAILIQVSERSGLVEVRTELPRRRNWSGGVDYTIALPNGANVAVHSVSGDLRITNVRGELRAQSVSGDVVGTGIGRARSIRTVSGDLQLTDAAADTLELGSVSGDVIVNGLKARSVDLESVSGSLRLTAVESERVSFNTISGDIDFDGRLARSGRYDMQTHSGDIRLTAAGNTGFDLDASTFSGDIRSDFQLSGAQPASGERRRNRELRGTFGDASAILTLKSFSGDVTLTRR